RDAHDALEQALEVGRADANVRAEGREGDGTIGMVLDVTADLPHHLHLRGRGVPRLTPPAGAEARALRIRRAGEEADLRAARPARRTGRAAGDTRRADGEDEASVAAPIAHEHRLPARGAVHRH